MSFHWRLVVNRNATFWYNFLLSGFLPKFNYFKKFSILWASKDHNYIFTNDDNLGLSFPVIIPFTSALFPTSLTRTILNIMLLIGIFFLSREVCLFQLYTLSFLMLLALIPSIWNECGHSGPFAHHKFGLHFYFQSFYEPQCLLSEVYMTEHFLVILDFFLN